VPTLKKDKFNSMEATNGDVLNDEALAGLDNKARVKLITHDKLKAEKVKDALGKSRFCWKLRRRKRRSMMRRPKKR
jgi:hypothetical protein